jgi:hypothetical protein
MTYQDWISRGTAVCDAECAEARGWKRSGRWWTKDGVTMALAEDLVITLAWSPTVNRNDAAMMVENVLARGVSVVTRFNKFLSDYVPHWPLSPLESLSLAPALIAYCAWRALKEVA